MTIEDEYETNIFNFIITDYFGEKKKNQKFQQRIIKFAIGDVSIVAKGSRQSPKGDSL